MAASAASMSTFSSTGAAICAALRNKTSRNDIRRLSNVSITDIVTHDGEVIGAVGFDIPTAARWYQSLAAVLSLGGMTKMFRRTTSPNNLAARA